MSPIILQSADILDSWISKVSTVLYLSNPLILTSSCSFSKVEPCSKKKQAIMLNLCMESSAGFYILPSFLKCLKNEVRLEIAPNVLLLGFDIDMSAYVEYFRIILAKLKLSDLKFQKQSM